MSEAYVKYYLLQSGAGANEETFGPLIRFSPKYQRGRGLGGVFSKLFRFLKPVLTRGLTFLKKEALNTGVDLISGLSQQKPMKEILRDRSFQIVDDLKDKASDKIKEKIQKMTGSGCKRRAAVKRSLVKPMKRKRRGKGIKRMQKTGGSHSKKYRVLDIFS